MTVTAVDHSRDHDLTVAGTQAACGWALHLLATEKHAITGKPLPLLSWVIRDHEPRLYGSVHTGTSTQRAAAVKAWATHLNGKTAEVAMPLGGPRFEFDAVAHGVEVHIQTYLDTATKEAA